MATHFFCFQHLLLTLDRLRIEIILKTVQLSNTDEQQPIRSAITPFTSTHASAALIRRLFRPNIETFVQGSLPFAGDDRKHFAQAPRYAVQDATNGRKVLIRHDDQKKRDAAGQVVGAKFDGLAVGFVPASAATEIKVSAGGRVQASAVVWAKMVPP